jgi:hypothetical protein
MSTWQQKFSVAVAEIEEEASTSSSPRHQAVLFFTRGFNLICSRAF